MGSHLSSRGRVARVALAVCAGALIAAQAEVARATPRPLPFTYGTETNPQGSSEVEQYVDVTPVRARSTSSGAPTWYLGSQFQAEYEYGITDRLELGLYVTWAPGPGDALTGAAQLTEGNGLKQRLRWVFAAPGAWPIDVGVYGEIVENDREIELEAKLLLRRRFGRLRVAANLVGEYELYYSGDARDVVLAPTIGATYEISPSLHVGLEGWSRAEYPHPAPAKRAYGLGPHVYAGPALLLNFGRLWWSVGVYGRVTDASHTIQPGEPFGRLWARSIIGIDL
jgi:hypothetical protein